MVAEVQASNSGVRQEQHSQLQAVASGCDRKRNPASSQYA